MSVREAQRPLPTLTHRVPSKVHLGSQGQVRGEEGEYSKELVGAPRGRDGRGSHGPPWQPNAGLWTKRTSTASGPPHLALPHPRADGGVGGTSSSRFGHQALDKSKAACGHLPSARRPIVDPLLLLC